MSLRTRVNGFTAWVNLRMREYNVSLSNVMLDLMNGTNLKTLVESMTGRDMANVQSFDGLTQQQKVTRAEWIIRELKQCNVIPSDTYVDARLFAMRSADHVFDMLWRLVCHDIWFVWERAEYLQHSDPAVLVQASFKWVPETIIRRSAKKKKSESLLSGFGSSTGSSPGPPSSLSSAMGIVWPDSELVKSYKAKLPDRDKYPKADECILELVNTHLKKTQEGQKLLVTSADDMADHRVLCCLINSFVPFTFTSEVLPNDRWTINICLETVNKMFHGESSFNSADLVEGDTMAICAYFCYFFMIAYKYRQAKAVVERVDLIHQMVRECRHIISQVPPKSTDSSHAKRHEEISQKIDNFHEEVKVIETKFDLKYCRNWVDHVLLTQTEIHKLIKAKIAERFDTVEVPRSITINDLSLAMNINLSLTGGTAFYHSTDKEQCSEYRKVVLRHKETKEYVDDFTARNKEPVRKLLGLKLFDVVDINPSDYPHYDFFFEASSRNKVLKSGSVMLYQVFPGNHIAWHKQCLKSIKENEIDTVKNMITFFKTQLSFINAKETNTGNTALHYACKNGCYSIALYLLENGANINALNGYRQSPLFSAVEGMQRKICRLLIEWGCNVNVRGIRGNTAFESIKNDEFREDLTRKYERLATAVPKITDGDIDALKSLIKDHVSGVSSFCTLRSRCINGSTLLHTAAYFGSVELVKSLLSHRVDVNLTDYKGATPLHRVRNVECLKALTDAGALINTIDDEGNSPLHVKCFGETNKPTQLECIEMLIENRARLLARNQRSLLPIHCCAMQGRIDGIEMLLKYGNDEIRESLASQDNSSPPSLIYLAISSDHLECAKWLQQANFELKEGEANALVEKVLTEVIKSSEQANVLEFLFECGATVNPEFSGGNTAVHFAAMIPASTDVLELLLSYGADIDAPNSEHSTPLFFSCQTDNMFAASVLLSRGADFRKRNNKGLTALDLINDFDEWIECGFFTEEIVARLKAYSLKHSRDLVRAIGQKVFTGYGSTSRGTSRTMNVSKSLLKPISPHPLPNRSTRPFYITKSLPTLLALPPKPVKKYPELLPNGGYLMF
ncbi:uncharacterized protein [Watersipora subatra]|uniref:uncharacterized protein n=1 Tax=Watersipora subatra TaxID=2589382 RepID=UPI00355AED5C